MLNLHAAATGPEGSNLEKIIVSNWLAISDLHFDNDEEDALLFECGVTDPALAQEFSSPDF